MFDLTIRCIWSPYSSPLPCISRRAIYSNGICYSIENDDGYSPGHANPPIYLQHDTRPVAVLSNVYAVFLSTALGPKVSIDNGIVILIDVSKVIAHF
jgi:hypothetical protein